jgi:hypothetical protein
MHRVLTGAVALLCWSSATVLAQGAAPAAPSPEVAEARAKVRNACAGDVQRLCSNVERAKGAMRACLDLNQASLSAECTMARAQRAALRTKAPNSD